MKKILYLLQNLQNEKGVYIGKFVKILQGTICSFKSKLITTATDRAVAWVNEIVSSVKNVRITVKNSREPSREETMAVLECLTSFFDKYYYDIKELIAGLADVDMYAEIVSEKIRYEVWESAFIVWKGGKDSEAARFYSYIYYYPLK